ncbi:hypothetical protein HPB48_014591 [Haemaphysalis longicornis]|uniref:Uncharacterized protein n=1 Tax=Haemaphysalis longicornis TaxID=44386 RepID=A0A9J6GIM2_HAELO|nr:hypothetical protein HPB48_014591 [Haemaphysalis longicornis]
MLECFMQPMSGSPHMLSDILHSDFFKQLTSDSIHDTILLLLYTDQLEITNPLGSGAGKHKILAVYFFSLNLHRRHRSKLNAIHLLLLATYKAVMRHGLEKVAAPMVEDLNFVHEDGIKGEVLHFAVVTVAICGDNLSIVWRA